VRHPEAVGGWHRTSPAALSRDMRPAPMAGGEVGLPPRPLRVDHRAPIPGTRNAPAPARNRSAQRRPARRRPDTAPRRVGATRGRRDGGRD